MEDYFDAFLYLANWGTHELMLRLPRRLLDPATARRYCLGQPASAAESGDHVILSFSSEEEGGDWLEDGDGVLASILPVRAEIERGDHRALYLAWLLCVQYADEDIDEPGLWKVPVMRKHGQVLTARSLAPIAFVMSVGALTLASAVSRSSRRALAAELALYGSLALLSGAASVRARDEPWALLPRVTAAYPAFHVGYGAGMAHGVARVAGRRRSR